MKTTFIIAIISLFLISSCIERRTPRTYNVIPKDEMISILVDLHLLDGILEDGITRVKLAKIDTFNVYNKLLQGYGYSRVDLDSSIYYYSLNIEEYSSIYEEVLNRLNQMETELKEEESISLENDQE